MSVTTLGSVRPRLRSRRISPARWGLYAFILITALYFLLPLYVMIVTSLKPMAEIRQGHLLAHRFTS